MCMHIYIISIPISRFQPFNLLFHRLCADYFIDANDEISSIELGEFREALDVAESKINTLEGADLPPF